MLLLALALAGCATQRSVRDAGNGALIARYAAAELGRPYRFGGDETTEGFDCSGLARSVHARASIVIARTAAAQFAAGPRVRRRDLLPGDLVFFRFGRGRAVDHVGVYVGDGAFVHAPRPGSSVQRVTLDAPWFQSRYAGAARYWRD